VQRVAAVYSEPEKEKAFSRYPIGDDAYKSAVSPPLFELSPRDFSPLSDRSPEKTEEDLQILDKSSESEPASVGQMSESERSGHSPIKDMSFEDMLLSGLLMLGGTSDVDEEIMIILGLMLIIGT
jgi:hypothetical protein